MTKKVFSKIPTPKKASIKTEDCLMSGLAVFHLKNASLLQFVENMSKTKLRANVQKLYAVDQIPSDTYMRERIDVIPTAAFREVFTDAFRLLQRGKVLESYWYLGKYLILSGDGTQCFCSDTIHCEYCCVKELQNGTVQYYHQCYGGVIVHPDIKQVLPLMPEFIQKQDGATKNDCERNASCRFYERVRKEHPHAQFLVVEDSLASNGPHLKKLDELKMKYVVGAKESDHKVLFDYVRHEEQTHVEFEKKGENHKFYFVNGAPLNDAHYDYKVNFLYYTNGKTTWTWVTNLEITKDNVYEIMRAGRARWHIENETFNTLKNQGFNFERNYGHGYENLSNNLAVLMFLAFFFDQIQLLLNKKFKMMRQKLRTFYEMWEMIRCVLQFFIFDDFDRVYEVLIENST